MLAAGCGGEPADNIPDATANPTHDATTIDSGTGADAAPDGQVAADASAPGFVIDGVVNAAEWGAANSHVNSVAVDGAFAGNALNQLLTYRDSTTLYLAIAGSLTAGNAIILYLDHDLAGADGLASPASLDEPSVICPGSR